MSVKLSFRCSDELHRKLCEYQKRHNLNLSASVCSLISGVLDGSDESLFLLNKIDKRLNYLMQISSKSAFHIFEQSAFMSEEITLNAEKEFESFIKDRRSKV